MKTDYLPGDCTDESVHLLAWFVNGTLGPDEAQRVRAHLEHCPTCRADANRLRTAQTLLCSAPSVEPTPQAGLRRLMARVDQAPEHDAAASGAISATRPAPEPDVAYAVKATAPWRRWARNPIHWLAVAVAIQACAIVAIVGTGLLDGPKSSAPPTFRTLTSTSADGPRLRVVFAATMTLAELQDLLRANQLVALNGPSDSGLFTLALQAPEADEQTQAAVVARLRGDARVRFAEAVRIEPERRQPR